MKTPYIAIHLKKLQHNIELIKKLCAKHHLQLTPVSKVVMGHPTISSLYSHGTHSIGDSRICDILRMRSNNISGPFMLIRSPAMSEARASVELADISMQSDLDVLEKMNLEAGSLSMDHQILLMIEMGDLREGIVIEELENYFKYCLKLKHLDTIGIGTNATCFAGLIPTQENLDFLFKAADLYRKYFKRDPLVSGGGSNLMPLILRDILPSCINHIRVGESIVMGVDAIKGELIPGANPDCFALFGEVIQTSIKPSGVRGPLAHNAFGDHPVFQDRGKRKHALVNIGRLDTDIRQIQALHPGIKVLGASSDHLVLDVEEAENIHTGTVLQFNLKYSSLLFAMNSEYVEKVFID